MLASHLAPRNRYNEQHSAQERLVECLYSIIPDMICYIVAVLELHMCNFATLKYRSDVCCDMYEYSSE